VTVSNHAGRAGAAADLLASHGFKVAGAIGVENYEEEGGTLTKIATPAPAASAAQPPAADEYKYKTTRLKRAEIDALLAKPENLLVIDVRRPDEITEDRRFTGLSQHSGQRRRKKSGLYPQRSRYRDRRETIFGRNGAAGDLVASHGFKVAGAIAAEYYEAEGGTADQNRAASARRSSGPLTFFRERKQTRRAKRVFDAIQM